MSVTATKSTARKIAPVKAETIVSESIARNSKYVAKAPTSNLAAFREFVLAESGDSLKSEAERSAFVLGNRLAGLRASYTADRKAGKLASPDESFSDYAIRTSGVTVPKSEAAKSALLAGIATYTRYVAYRNSRNAASSSK